MIDDPDSQVLRLEDAKALFRARKFDEALNQFLALHRTLCESQLQSEVCSYISNCHGWLGNYEQSIVFSKMAFELCTDPVHARYLNSIYLSTIGDFQSAVTILKELLRTNASHFDAGILELALGVDYCSMGEFASSVRTLDDAHDLIDRGKHPEDYAKILCDLGVSLSKVGEPKRSLELLEECKGYQQHLNVYDQALMHRTLSGHYTTAGQYEWALETARAALGFVMKFPEHDCELIAQYALSVAELLVVLGRFEQGLECLNGISTESGDAPFKYRQCANTAKSLFMLLRYKDAIPVIRNVLDVLRNVKEDDEAEYQFTKILAISLFEIGERKEAGELFKTLVSDTRLSETDREICEDFLDRI